MHMYRADLHIHSRYSRATSRELTPENLYYWAQIKGLNLIGTGDLTHPQWLAEIEEKLEFSGNGLYSLKKELIPEVPVRATGEMQFVLTGEISSIYKKSGKTRKVHTVICLPDFESAHTLQFELQRRGYNTTSDGRPILGLDARDLAEMCMNISPRAIIFPAHIWTPWFSALGEKSGFDSVQECFGDMAQHIYAVETGLSSDVPMNRLCSELDRYVMLSNSDAHSPDKLGRNATVFEGSMSYGGLLEQLKNQNPAIQTIDLFPQEGKYFLAGHRKCNFVADPLEALETRFICPVCKKEITRGVMNRVAELADKDYRKLQWQVKPYRYVVPLKEILSEIFGVGEKSKKITLIYNQIIASVGNELDVLLTTPVKDIVADEKQEFIAEAVQRVRDEQVFVKAGYDGEYGQVKAFHPSELGFGSDGFDAGFIACNQANAVAFDVHRCKELLAEINAPRQINGKNVADDGQICLF